MIKAVKLYLKEGTVVEMLFNDGLTKRYDMMTLAGKFPELLALKDREVFLEGKMFGGAGIRWNDYLDIESETIYEDGETVDNDDNIIAIITGSKLKDERLKKGLTQSELSKLCGVPQSDISRIEKGEFNPTVGILEKIARGLDKKVEVHFK